MPLPDGQARGLDRWLARLPFVRGRQPEALPLTLDRRRIYVLPTRLGLLAGGLLLAMLLGALNYNNNPGLMLAFLLAAVVHNGVVQAHLRLSGLRLVGLSAAPVTAGEALDVRIRFAPGSRTREGVGLEVVGGPAARCDDAAGEWRLSVPTRRRGLHDLGRLRISTTRPLGLARAWSWWWPAQRLLVYPAPERGGPPLPGAEGPGQPRPRPGRSGEDTHHLRDYRTGDAPRQIAWRASARLDRLVVREYETGASRDVRLAWEALRHLPYEARIARLARWVDEAEREGRRYRLELPGEVLGPARGAEHRHACLRALALLPEAV